MVDLPTNDILKHIEALIPHVMTKSGIEYKSIRSQLEKMIQVPKKVQPFILNDVLRAFDKSIIGRIDLLGTFLEHIVQEISSRKKQILSMIQQQDQKTRQELTTINSICETWKNRVNMLKQKHSSNTREIWNDLLDEYNRVSNNTFHSDPQNSLQVEIRRFLSMPSYHISSTKCVKTSAKLNDINKQLSMLIELHNKKLTAIGAHDNTITEEIRRLISEREIEARKTNLFSCTEVSATSENKSFKDLARLLLAKLPNDDNDDVLKWKMNGIIDDECSVNTQRVHSQQKYFLDDLKKTFIQQARKIVADNHSVYINADNQLRDLSIFHKTLFTDDMNEQLDQLTRKFQSYMITMNNRIILSVLDKL